MELKTQLTLSLSLSLSLQLQSLDDIIRYGIPTHIKSRLETATPYLHPSTSSPQKTFPIRV
jgi:hypothetical protein